MGTTPQEALMQLTDELLFRVVLNGTDQYFRADALINAVKNVRETNRRLDSQDETLDNLSKRWEEKFTETVAKFDNGAVKPTAIDDLAIEGFVKAAVAGGVDVDDLGLVRAADVANHCKAYITREEILPNNCAILFGHLAGRFAGKLNASLILGDKAGQGGLVELTDVVLLGADAQALAAKTAAVGNTRTQVHIAQPAATRADERDVYARVPLELGLDFIRLLTPEVVTMDLREDYIDYASVPLPPTPPPAAPVKPEIDEGAPGFVAAWQAYQQQLAPWRALNENYQAELVTWRAAYGAWRKENDPVTLKGDGSQRQHRARHLITAQNLRAAALAMGREYPGVIDSAADGGLDVLTARETELIPVLVKAVQQLDTFVNSDEFANKVAYQLFLKSREWRLALKAETAAVEETSHE